METKKSESKGRIKKVFYFIGGILAGVLSFIAGVVCRRKDVQHISERLNNTRDELGGIGERIDTAKGTVKQLDESINRSRAKVDECKQVLDRIRKEYK